MTDRELVFSVTLKDCEVQTFCAGGPGGQNQNKRHTGVRIIHRASGAKGEAREQRSQLQNKRLAFRRMADHPMFRAWVALQSYERKQIDARALRWLDGEMEHPERFRVERWDRGHWVALEVGSDEKTPQR